MSSCDVETTINLKSQTKEHFPGRGIRIPILTWHISLSSLFKAFILVKSIDISIHDRFQGEKRSRRRHRHHHRRRRRRWAEKIPIFILNGGLSLLPTGCFLISVCISVTIVFFKARRKTDWMKWPTFCNRARKETVTILLNYTPIIYLNQAQEKTHLFPPSSIPICHFESGKICHE